LRKIDILDNLLLSKIYKIKIFQYLDDNEKKMLLNIADYFEYHKDEKIISQGEISYCFFAVISGRLKVSIDDENGNQINISEINEGDFFGENGIFTDGQKRTANISPIDTALILRIGRDDFFNFIRLYPKAGVNLLMLFVHGLMKRLNSANKELVNEREEMQDKIPFFEKSGQ
jgi:cAMP-binding proteins - catabolite gene activator and regulatory subunit of cAMP-dependent protein kinases